MHICPRCTNSELETKGLFKKTTRCLHCDYTGPMSAFPKAYSYEELGGRWFTTKSGSHYFLEFCFNRGEYLLHRKGEALGFDLVKVRFLGSGNVNYEEEKMLVCYPELAVCGQQLIFEFLEPHKHNYTDICTAVFSGFE